MIEWLTSFIEGDRLFGGTRSGVWPSVRDKHIEEHPFCAVCNTKKHPEVHHKRPVHLFPELELDPENLITLCGWRANDCHRIFGHCFSWYSYNKDIEKDAVEWNERISSRP